jgi:AcrR family transcriptional regulator
MAPDLPRYRVKFAGKIAFCAATMLNSGTPHQRKSLTMEDQRPVLKESLRGEKRRTETRRSKKPETHAVNSRHSKQREHILRNAGKLFAEAGYAVTTMDVLSEMTKMNKASLYYYFGSKRDILFELSKLAIADGVLRAVPAPRMKSARDGLIHLIDAGIQTMAAHENEHRIFQQEYPYYGQIFSAAQFRELMELQRRYMKVVYEVLQQGMDSGEFRVADVRLTGGLLVTWINSTLRFLSTAGHKELTEMLKKLLLPALAK